jgi:hypothetical protein
MQPRCLSYAGQHGPRFRALATIVAIVSALATLAVAGGSASSVAAASTQRSNTVWLCRPGQALDPCAAPLRFTVVPSRGPRVVQTPSAAKSPAFDCFYVYPTVSTQLSSNANLEVQPAELGAAVAQASRFSQVCRVWAPMYRQRTLASLLSGLGSAPQADEIAYNSLLSGWKDYLAHDNDGRPIIFIGHSQGAAMLIRLLASQVDPDPALRARTVVAILAGGNVTVPTGKVVGSTFHHLPLCTATAQAGCVIAYSSYPSQPPADSLFGRPGRGVSLQSGQTATSALQVACVNPAAVGGGTAQLAPYFPAKTSTPPPPVVTTPWVTYPALYSATCRSGGGASWLQVNTLDAAGRPVITESLGPTWGYHLEDINLALGNLLNDVRAEEAAYTHRH